MKTRLFGLFKPAAKTPPGADVAERMAQARALHMQGDLGESAKLYREMLAAHPKEPEVYYRYGNLLKDQGALEDALLNYDQAIARKADYAQAYCNRAVVFGFMNRLPDALDSYDRAIAADSTDAIAQCNRAVLLLGLGKKDAALAGFDATIACDDKNFTAFFYRAALLQERKLWPDALAAYDQAIVINPNEAVALYNQGVVRKELRQWTAALNSLGRAIALNPAFTLAYSNRGEIFEQLNQLPAAHDDYAQAIKLYDQAIALNAKDAGNYSKRGLLLQKMCRYSEALADYNTSLSLDSNDAETWFNRGTVFKDLDDLNSALESYERAIALKPSFAGAYLNRGVALQSMGQLEAAIESYKQAIDIKPDLPECRYNLALAGLARGDYVSGWAEYEWRWRAKSGPSYRERRDFREPLWLGKDALSGKTILLYAEQGLGDALQFCRYISWVARLGARVVLEVPSPLQEVCGALPDAAVVVPFGTALPAFDYQCPLMSLPLAFNTTLESIPSATGYLKCHPGKLAHWQLRLGTKTKPRIGLTWSGNRSAGTDRKRHFELSRLIPYLSQDFQYFCLQTDVGRTDQATLEMTPEVFQFPESDLDFGSTAALCECMDLVISVDTSIAHLSSALGKTTWILLPFVADWRWLTDRDDSPWYSSARLFRQKVDGDWEGVFERVAKELRTAFTQ